MKRRRIGIYVLIDGLGARDVRDHEFLREWEYRASLRTVLGDRYANQATIVTGRLPREHGVGALHQRALGSSAFAAARRYGWLPDFIADRSSVRRQIQEQVALADAGVIQHCPTRLLAKFDVVDVEQIFAPGSFCGHQNIFSTLSLKRLRFHVRTGVTEEQRNLMEMEETLQDRDVDFEFLRISSLGQLLQQHGSEGTPFQDRLRWIEAWLRRILERAEQVAEVVEFFVLGDQGMSDVHGAVDLISEVEHEFGRNGRHYLGFYDRTMARFWSDGGAVLDEIDEYLTSRTDGRPVSIEELELLGWDFPDHRFGEAIYLMNEGLQIVPSYRDGAMLRRASGYHPDSRKADACLLGLWSPSLDLRHVADVHRLMFATAERLSEDG